MPKDLRIIEVAPPDEFLPVYQTYLAGAGHNTNAQYYIPQGDGGTLDPELAMASLQIGRAAELAIAGIGHAADVRLAKTQGRLQRFADASEHTLDVTRGAVLLGSTAAVLRGEDGAYDELHANVVEDIGEFRRKAARLVRNNRRAGRDDMDGPAGLYTGLFAQSVALGALTSFRGVFAMPVLPHHDRTVDPAESHDIVVFAKDATARFEHGDGPRDPFIASKTQVKNHCLALCTTGDRSKTAEAHLRRERRKYYDDIVLCSGHCDLGDTDNESESGLDIVASLLIRQQRGGMTQAESLALEQVSRRLAGRLFNATPRRMGKKSTAFRRVIERAMAPNPTRADLMRARLLEPQK